MIRTDELTGMEFTGERFVPNLNGQISYEHLHRYAIASHFGAGKRVLDVASGEGYGAALIARRALSVVGVDIDQQSIDHARGHYYATNLRFSCASVTELPLVDQSVDIIASFETIEHTSDQERMLDEFLRVLTPSGILLISSPNKLIYSDQANYSNPFHVKELYFSDFRDLLTRRFRNVAIYGQRLAASSFVHPLAGGTCSAPDWYSGSAEGVHAGLSALADPAYFIAVCSHDQLPADISSGYLNPADDLIGDLIGEVSQLRGQFAARVTVGGTPAALPAAETSENGATFLPDDATQLGALANDAPDAGQIIEQLRREHEAQVSEIESLRAAYERSAQAQALQNERMAELESARLAAEGRCAEGVEVENALRRELDGTRLALRKSQESAVAAITELAEERNRVNAIAGQLIRARESQIVSEREFSEALKAERTSHEVERGNLLREIAGLRETLAGADRDSRALRELLASHSWKLTAPLRRAVKLVRR